MAKRQFGSIRKLPSGRFQARYRLATGRMVSAPVTFMSKGDAARHLASVETDMTRGTYLDPEAGRITLQEWAEEWLGRPGKRPTSVVRDRQALEVWLRTLGTVPLFSVTAHDVQTAVDARAEEAAPATLRRDFSALRAPFNAAVDLDMLAKSPARRTKLPEALPPERATLTPAELAKLVAEVPERYRALVLVGSVLGLRWSEAVGLRIGDVDFAKATITVAQTVEELTGHVRLVPYGKTRRSLRSLSVPRFVLQALQQHLYDHRNGDVGADDLVFVGSRGGILRRNFVERVLRPAVRRAGLPGSHVPWAPPPGG